MNKLYSEEGIIHYYGNLAGFVDGNRMIIDARWDVEKQIKVASIVKPNEATGSMESILGSVAYRLPYSSEIEGQFLEGDMLREASLKSGKGFQSEIERIAQGVYV